MLRRLARIARRLFTLPRFSQGYQFDALIAQQIIPGVDVPGLIIRELRPEDESGILELERIYANSMTRERIKRRLLDGKRCFSAWVNGECVSYVWFRLDVIWVKNLYFDEPIGPGDVYVFDAHTIPACRGRRIYPHLTGTALLRIAAQTGRTRALYLVRTNNRASLRAAARMGLRPLAHRRVITMFGRHFKIETRFSVREDNG